MAIKRKFWIFFILCESLLVNTSIQAQNFPHALIYKDKPIDSLCIYEAKDSPVALEKCGVTAEPNRKITGTENELTKKGYVGFDYTWSADKSDDFKPNAYSYYKIIGNIKNDYIVYGLNNTGGSGQFSGIYLIKRENDSITVTTLAYGDRCNGGITAVRLQNNKIFYTINITAADFFSLVNQKPNHIDLYSDLSSCAACCIATADMEMDPLQADSDTLITVDLGPKFIDIIDRNNRYQYCFDILIIDSQRRGKRFLDSKDLAEFVQKFKASCE